MGGQGWVKEFAGAVTVCDTEGRIIEMNDKAAEVFAKDGGAKLIGANVLDCHPEPSRSKLKAMLASGRTNVYTIEKKGRRNSSTSRPGTTTAVTRVRRDLRRDPLGHAPLHPRLAGKIVMTRSAFEIFRPASRISS